jgi:hypothetical protein
LDPILVDFVDCCPNLMDQLKANHSYPQPDECVRNAMWEAQDVWSKWEMIDEKVTLEITVFELKDFDQLLSAQTDNRWKVTVYLMYLSFLLLL